MTDPVDQALAEEALRLAREAAADGEVPIGAVVALDGRIIGRGRNRMESLQDATAHAELEAIREASRVLGTWRLEGCVLAVTLEPCPMCAGAILNSRIARVVYGAPDRRLGACDTHFGILRDNPIGREVETAAGVLGEDSANLLKEFFRDLREGRRLPSAVRRGLAPPKD